jgi:hypothetical protein
MENFIYCYLTDLRNAKMKLPRFSTIVAGIGLAFVTAGASALDIPGYVTVYTGTTTQTMDATMNVGLEPATGHSSSYVHAYYWAGSGVNIRGYDGVNGLSFFCYVATSDPNYPQAVEIANNLTNGSRVYVERYNDYSDCINLRLYSTSYYQS